MTQPAVQALLQRVWDEAAGRRLPEATYRLQFHAGFRFADAQRIVPYLQRLGISHAYASPYLKARPGSMHGYDITDHRVLNPEVGDEEEHAAWVDALRAHGMGQILDTVPNHMGIAGNENPWWNDVLENGPSSPFAAYFDIAWDSSHREELHGRILLPVLGDLYGKVLEAGEVRVEFAGGAFAVRYFDHRFPVAPRSYRLILAPCLEKLEKELPADDPGLVELQSIITAVNHLPRRTETEPAKVAERQREKEVVKRRLASLVQTSGSIRGAIEQSVARMNGTAGDSKAFDSLNDLLDDQVYRLAFWRVAVDEINYRRFFDINELAAIRTELPEVFAATHERVLRMLAEGKADGLRIDHPDGLFDPRRYLTQLQESYVLARARYLFQSESEFAGGDWGAMEPLVREGISERFGADSVSLPIPLYVVVEKILAAGEPLADDWPVMGTSGYDFLNVVNGLFVDPANGPRFTAIYRDWVSDAVSFAETAYQKKSLILRVSLSSELHMLSFQLDRLAQKNRWSRDFTFHSLRVALREVIACFPVYRSYITDSGARDSDRKAVDRAVSRAKARNPAFSAAIFDFVRDMLLLKFAATATEQDRADQCRFVGTFQQVTSPVMAKGVEDTAFYVYNRLVALNEVGGDPGRFGLVPAAVHRYLLDRQARWPTALSTLSTHDTKRSEDVRARLAVLSECPDEWREALSRWSKMNEAHRTAMDEDGQAPDANDEYFLYQTLLGAWPLEPHGADEYASFVRRIRDYMHKAVHEAKVHSSWINPNSAYDAAVQRFVEVILDPSVSQAFHEDFLSFQRRISHYGLLNSLAQTLVKITAPGVPDTYQGTEVWDFSLVDPDNRRPVDFPRLENLLAALDLQSRESDGIALARELLAAKEDGRIKLYLTSQALRCRRANPGLFGGGEYVPLEAVGALADHVFGFLRRQGNISTLVAVPRLMTRLRGRDQVPLGAEVWRDTEILLPQGSTGVRWQDAFTGQTLVGRPRAEGASLRVGDVLAHLPLALLLTSEDGSEIAV